MNVRNATLITMLTMTSMFILYLFCEQEGMWFQFGTIAFMFWCSGWYLGMAQGIDREKERSEREYTEACDMEAAERYHREKMARKLWWEQG